jgi:energy-coupling factor transporter transmembrane protein EcfT
MAELNSFSYVVGRSILHRHDVRFKMASLALMTTACVLAPVAGLGVVSLVLAALALHLRLPWRIFGGELRILGLFLLFIWAARALTTPGTVLAAAGSLAVTREGLAQGGLICWRLLNIVMLSLLFVRSTRPAEIKAGVGWLLRPLPLIDAGQAAVMVGLIVRFIPVLHHQIRETRIAWRARGGAWRKNPLAQIKYLALPAMRRTILSADQLALAMEARCFSPQRTDPAFRCSRLDVLLLAAGGLILAATLLI